MDLSEEKIIEEIKKSFPNLSNLRALPQSASKRRYFVIGDTGASSVGAADKAGVCEKLEAAGSADKTATTTATTFIAPALAVYNEDIEENEAYLDFSRQFLSHGLKVPKIIAEAKDKRIYLVENVGEHTLFEHLSKRADFLSPQGVAKDETSFATYKKIVDDLLGFQYVAAKNFSYQKALGVSEFNQKAMYWDLCYFKYYFLKLSAYYYDETLLEKDFDALLDFLSQVPSENFVYRDFQSRNIVVKGSLQNLDFSYVDFQSGRKGCGLYDLASLLYEAKANLSGELRSCVLAYYIDECKKRFGVDTQNYEAYFYAFVLLRIFQALGAYGLRGIHERKAVFLQSIPFAIKNLKTLLDSTHIKVELPYIKALINQIYTNYFSLALSEQKLAVDAGVAATTKSAEETSAVAVSDDPDAAPKLSLSVHSFSFKKTQPQDHSGNGGGFVFDCRGLPNPGRLEQYKALTGKDEAVANYLKQYPQVESFIDKAVEITYISVKNYLERGFSNLYVAFACTGGQHRSVYCAIEYCKAIERKLKEKDEALAKRLNISLNHQEFPD